MRIAILSDIHGNLEALTRALSIISESRIDNIVCLGDVVGYGANPNECLELIRSHTDHILLGNHDEASVDLAMTEYFNPFARTAAEWTNAELTKENLDFISHLRHRTTLEGMLFVHSSPFEPAEWHYIISAADAHENFPFFTEPICFVGHSHVPGVFCEDIWTKEVERGKKFLVNVGSIGQPRDRDPRLSFGIMDTDEWRYTNVRSPYDVTTASEKIRNAGLPRQLAERLLEGK
jgi:predicted phosphodiesterase